MDTVDRRGTNHKKKMNKRKRADDTTKTTTKTKKKAKSGGGSDNKPRPHALMSTQKRSRVKLTELWNVERLQHIAGLAVVQAAYYTKAILQCQSSEQVKVYEYANDEQMGRMYVRGAGAQRMPGWIRRVAQGEYYYDVDMVAAVFSVLLNVCRAHDISSCSFLLEYVANRETKLTQWIQTFGGTRHEAKKAFNKILFYPNGGYINGGISSNISTFLHALQTEVAQIVSQLKQLYPKHWKFAQQVKQQHQWNVDGTFVSYLLFDFENMIVQRLRKFLTNRSIKVDVLVFDGLQVRKSCVDEAGLVHAMGEFEVDLRDETGFDVKFALKSMEPNNEDWTLYNGPQSTDTIIQDGGYYWKRCADDQQQQQQQQSQLFELIPNNVAAAAADDDDSMWAAGTRIINTPAEWVEKTTVPFEEGTHTAIVAPMGSGKTTYLKSIFEEHLKKPGIKPTVMFITNRISLSNFHYSEFKEFGFVHYKEEVNARLQIINYESLHRQTRVYDWIILDEVRSIMRSVTSEKTNNNQLRWHFDMFCLLLKQAKWICMLDADLEIDACVPKFWVEVFHENIPPLSVYRFTRVKLPRQVYLVNEQKAVETLCDDIQNGRRVVVCHRSHTYLKKLWAYLLQWMPGLQIKCYYGGQDDVSARKDMENVNVAWSSAQVIMYTSTITVGVDYQGAVHRVYVFVGRHNGPTAAETIQMIGRVRNLTTEEVIVSMGALKEDYQPPQISDTMNQWQERKEMCNEYFSVEAKNNMISFAPTKYAFIKAYNYIESTRYFPNDFVRLCQRKGWTIRQDVSTVDSGAAMPQSEYDEEIFDRIEQPIQESVMMEATRRRDMGAASEEDKLTIDMYHVLHWFWHNDDSIPYETYKNLKKNIGGIMTLALLKKYGTADGLPEPYNTLFKKQELGFMYGKYAEYITFEPSLLEKLYNVTKLLGLQGPVDTSKTFTLHQANINAPIQELKKQLGWSDSKERKSNRGILNLALKQFGLKLDSKQMRFPNNERYQEYQIAYIPIGEGRTTVDYIGPFWNSSQHRFE